MRTISLSILPIRPASDTTKGPDPETGGGDPTCRPLYSVRSDDHTFDIRHRHDRRAIAVPDARAEPVPGWRDRGREGDPARSRRVRAAVLGAVRVRHRARLEPEGRAHVALRR